jgi:hypothetical protein
MKNISQQIYAYASHTITDIIWDSIENSVESELSDKIWRKLYSGTLRPANPVVRHAVYQEMSEYEFN